MSLVVMGLSHHTAPMSLLEEAALDDGDAAALADRLSGAENVREALVLATCNRLEVYAEAVTFHGAVADLGSALVAATGIPQERLIDHLYVHYEDRAIAHLFTVACGLDSMAVGESSILGQLRTALRRAQRDGRAGPELNGVVQHALRVGKRAHTETGLDSASVSLVEAGLTAACEHVGPLAGARVLVVGAGSIAGLTVATIDRAGSRDLVIASRTLERARRLAAPVGARTVPMTRLETSLLHADIVVSCTGAVGHVIDVRQVEVVAALRGGRPQAYVDLALPRDIHPAAAEVPGVLLVGLAELGERLRDQGAAPDDVAEVRDLVTAEVAAYLARRRMTEVAPTVAALRGRATNLMEAELERLEARLPSLADKERAEVRLAMHRLVEKLLHTPTVRVKQLACQEDGDYAQALRELFALDPYDTAAVSRPPDTGVLQ